MAACIYRLVLTSFMYFIHFVVKYSEMAHPNQGAVADLWLKKALNEILFRGRSIKGAMRDNGVNLSLPFYTSFQCDIANSTYHQK